MLRNPLHTHQDLVLTPFVLNLKFACVRPAPLKMAAIQVTVATGYALVMSKWNVLAQVEIPDRRLQTTRHSSYVETLMRRMASWQEY